MEKNAKGYKDMILLKRKRKKKKKNQISENKRYQHSKTTQTQTININARESPLKEHVFYTLYIEAKHLKYSKEISFKELTPPTI